MFIGYDDDWCWQLNAAENGSLSKPHYSIELHTLHTMNWLAVEKPPPVYCQTTHCITYYSRAFHVETSWDEGTLIGQNTTAIPKCHYSNSESENLNFQMYRVDAMWPGQSLCTGTSVPVIMTTFCLVSRVSWLEGSTVHVPSPLMSLWYCGGIAKYRGCSEVDIVLAGMSGLHKSASSLLVVGFGNLLSCLKAVLGCLGVVWNVWKHTHVLAVAPFHPLTMSVAGHDLSTGDL